MAAGHATGGTKVHAAATFAALLINPLCCCYPYLVWQHVCHFGQRVSINRTLLEIWDADTAHDSPPQAGQQYLPTMHTAVLNRAKQVR